MLIAMNKRLNIKFMLLAGLAAVAAGCGNSGSETLKAAPVAVQEAETVMVAPGVYYAELPNGFRLETNYFELDASSAETLRAMAAQDPERAEQLNKEADRLEAGLQLIDRAGGAKAIAQAKGIPQDKGKGQGTTMLTGCTYKITAVPYEEAYPNANVNGAYAYGSLICQNGLPFFLSGEVVETEVVIDGHVYPGSRVGDPYDSAETIHYQSRTVAKDETNHTCSSEARVSATILFGIELPFTSVSEHNNRCFNLFS